MSRTALCITLLALCLTDARANNNVTESDTCSLEESPWSLALEEWATSPSTRGARVLNLPARGYYVTDRVDLPPPPPPPPLSPGHQPTPYTEWQPPPPPPPQPQPLPTTTGKIVNKPPAGYNKDKFRPSPEYHPGNQVQSSQYRPQPAPAQGNQPYPPGNQPYPPGNQPYPPGNQPYPPGNQPYPPGNQPHGSNQLHGPGNQYTNNQNVIPINQHTGPNNQHLAPTSQHVGPNDRVDAAPPRKEVSETDLYLLAAIEKLVYRADTMEKRLRKAEEALHTLLVGKEPKPEPCGGSFRRVGGACYWWSDTAVDWQSAAKGCRQLGSALVELARPTQRQTLAEVLQKDKRSKDMDWWTGGLNPGLLWIWSGSARPVLPNATAPGTSGTTGTSGTISTIPGEGRCLALVWDHQKQALLYRGQDCAFRHRYVCEKAEDKSKLSNDIERAARHLLDGGVKRGRTARVVTVPLPDDDES